MTPLMMATKQKCAEIVKILSDVGADPNVQAKEVAYLDCHACHDSLSSSFPFA